MSVASSGHNTIKNKITEYVVGRFKESPHSAIQKRHLQLRTKYVVSYMPPPRNRTVSLRKTKKNAADTLACVIEPARTHVHARARTAHEAAAAGQEKVGSCSRLEQEVHRQAVEHGTHTVQYILGQETQSTRRALNY